MIFILCLSVSLSHFCYLSLSTRHRSEQEHPPSSILSFKMANKYENCDIPLGSGSYGHVDKYRQKETNIFVAVKTIDVSKLKNENWKRELKVWQQIRPHENVVPLLDHWMINENLRAVMPLARCNLSKYVEQRRIEMEEKGTLIDSDFQKLLIANFIIFNHPCV